MDYALPRADDLPCYDLGFNSTRCTTNPLGVKGCGEAGAVGAFPAVMNAIADALAPFGTVNFVGPATPERIWRATRAERSLKPGGGDEATDTTRCPVGSIR
jgi:carbon-monoxide dehydrogenase large subunit